MDKTRIICGASLGGKLVETARMGLFVIKKKKIQIAAAISFFSIFLFGVYTIVMRDRYEHSYPFAEFETTMGLGQTMINRALANKNWKIVRNLYNEYLINKQRYTKTPRIPKIIHHIWLGSTFPEKYKVLRETWIKNHPDWTFMLWTDKEVEQLNLKNKNLYDEVTNYGAKSDIARYEILYKIGGLYVDTDFECLKPFDVFHHCCDFYAGVGAWDNLISFNGLIGAAPGHPVMKECIDCIKPMPSKNETPAQLHFRTGPHYFTCCFFNGIKNHDGPSVLFPANYFYPWPHHQRDKKTREQILKWVRPESFAIHHWHVSWVES